MRIFFNNLRNMNKKTMAPTKASIEDVAKYVQNHKESIVNLTEDKLIKLPEIRDLYIKEIFLDVKSEKEHNIKDIDLIIKGENFECGCKSTGKRNLIFGSNQKIFDYLSSQDFTQNFKQNFVALKDCLFTR